jgi:hypothetical protein
MGALSIFSVAQSLDSQRSEAQWDSGWEDTPKWTETWKDPEALVIRKWTSALSPPATEAG